MPRNAVFLGAALLLALPALAEPPVVRLVEFEAIVNPITKNRIIRAIDEAAAQGDDLVLIRLDTPGGLVDSMQAIVQRMLNSEVPVVAWVGPPGAHAASAGFVILMAADVAAMAPGTRTGAASTVFGTGEGSEDNVLLKKSNEDIAALVRSMAEKRGRNVEKSEEAVFSAKAYEESVALAEGLIDLVAGSQAELLQLLDGREVQRFDGTTVVLRTADAQIVTTEFKFKQEFMEMLSHPIVAYLLFTFGMLGLYFEFTNPGAIFPGVVGVLCLLLFILTAQALPISYVGVLLILLAAVMFVLEIKVTSFGLLTLGGVVCLVIGSVILIDGPIPELRVPPAVVLPTSLVVAALCAVVVRLAIRARRAQVATGIEGLTGEVGTVRQPLDPEGTVFVHGELWTAVSTTGPLPAETRIRVVRVDDMTLTVEPIEPRRS